MLMANYDTWAGFSRDAPGADDNSTGEEMLKQYILRDPRKDSPPRLTHVYFFAGSEECGTRGLPVLRRRRREKHIPAAALITMSPGKCSPFVVGGKLHTAQDTPDRVYSKPLAEVMTILDYAFDILEGGERPSRPREISEHHYARLYRDGDELFAALKDAIQPNRRNINSIFRVSGDVSGSHAKLKAREVLS